MHSLVSLIFAGLLVVHYACGQSAKVEWKASGYHNPQKMSLDCGFPRKEVGYICDPNGVLKVRDLQAVNWILRDAAYNSTKCPCSTYYCEKSDARKRGKGYKIAVALVERMEKYSGDDGRRLSSEELAKRFSGSLKTTYWKIGGCEEEIIIFYSVDDKMLSIDPGSTAALKLTPPYIELLTRKIGGRLNSGQIVEALNVLIYDIKLLLNCDLDNPYDCTIYERSAASSIKTTFVSLTTLVMAFVFSSLLF